MNKTCYVHACGKKVKGKRRCNTHLEQVRTLGQEKISIGPQPRHKYLCSHSGCGEKSVKRLMCDFHYRRALKGADLDAPRMPTRTSAQIAIRDSNLRKQCRTCREWLPESEYSKTTIASDGLLSACRCCGVMERYSMNRKGYYALLESQGGACAICGKPEEGKRLYVDHDHSCCPQNGSCGECVRSLLCRGCNSGIGFLGEDVERVKKAYDYLVRWGR